MRKLVPIFLFLASFISTVNAQSLITIEGLPLPDTQECWMDLSEGDLTATTSCPDSSIVYVNYDVDTLALNCTGNFTLRRTWIFIDLCSSVDTVVQNLQVVDSTPPVFNNSIPQDVTVNCGNIPLPDFNLTASDECVPNVLVYHTDVEHGTSCMPGNYIERIYTADVGCGNIATGVQIINIIPDSSLIEIVGIPAEQYLECDFGIPPVDPVGAITTCPDSTVTIDWVDVISPDPCYQTIERIWTAYDNCGNTTSASQFFYLMDNTTPILLDVPADIDILCTEQVPTPYPVSAVDNCSINPIVTVIDESFGSPCDPTTTNYILRTWTATDECGNIVTGQQHIYQLADSTNTVIQLVGVPDNMDNVMCDQIPAPAVVDAITTCQDSFVNVTYYETSDQGQGLCFYSIQRVWIAYDNCGNTDSMSQFLYVADYETPILIDVPADINISCTEQVPAPYPVSAEDNCSLSPMVTVVDETFGNPCDPTTTNYVLRTWTATDDCGNIATGQQHIYQVTDTSFVTLIGVPESADANCDFIPNPPIVEAVTTCQDSFVNIIFYEISDPVGCDYTIQRVWTVNDNCGNTDSMSQFIYVFDNNQPELLDVPADIEISCTDSVPAPFPVQAIDNCGFATVSVSDQMIGNPCDPTTTNYVLRTWIATDECGNTSAGTQQITLLDTEVSTITLLSVPPDMTAECDNIPATPMVEGMTTCQDSFVNVLFNEISLDGFCPESFTIVRTWEATDNCGGITTATQNITVEDTQTPILFGVPDTITVLCSEIPSPAAVQAVDNCDIDVEINITEIQIGSPCQEGSAIIRTWTAIDNCGNATAMDQIIYTLPDPSEIFLTNVPADEYVECDQFFIPGPGSVGAYTTCLDSFVNITYDEANIPGSCPGSYILQRTWIAFDYCGNGDTAVQMVYVEDTQAPIFEVMSDVHLECGEDPTGVPPLPVIDNCDLDVDVTYTEEEFGVICTPGYYVLRTYTLIDDCGNQATGTQVITVQTDSIPPCEDPILSIIATDANCGGSDGSAYLELIDDPLNYYFNWTPNVSIEHFATDLTAGVYTVEIISTVDPNCVFVKTIVINSLDLDPAIVEYTTPAGCDGYNGGAQIVPSNYEYYWSDGLTGDIRQDLAVGTYEVTATDAAGFCSQLIIVEIGYDSTTFEVMPIISQQPTCGNADGIVTLEMIGGSGDYTYSWGTSDVLSGLAAGDYEIEVTDNATGCTVLATFILNGNISSATIIITELINPGCNQTNGAVVYDVFYDSTFVQPAYITLTDNGGNEFTAQDLPVGEYCINVMDSNTCLAGQNCFVITDSIGMDPINVVDVIPAGCNFETGGATLLPATYIYTWMDGVVTNIREDLAAGIYQVTATDGICSEIVEVIIEQLEPLVIYPEIISQPTCDANNGVVEVFVTGGTGDFSFSGTWGTSALRTDLAPGTYEVTVIDNQTGCLATEIFTLSSTSGPVATIVETIPATCGSNTGGAILAPSTYVYNWQDGGSGDIRNDLFPGVYDVTVTDSDSLCSTLLTVIIEEDFNSIIVDAVIMNEPSCGDANGTVEIVVSGGSGDYSYDPNWGPSAIRTDLLEGTYTIEVTDNMSGCTGTISFVLNPTSGPQATIVETFPATCESNTGVAILSPSTYVYDWQDGGSGDARNDLAAGTYDVTVSDSTSSCTALLTVTIDQVSDLLVDAEVINQPTCGEPNGTVEIFVSGGSGDYAYSWGVNSMRDDLAAGAYSVTVTDNMSGCIGTVDFTLIDNVVGSTINITEIINPSCNEANGEVIFDEIYELGFVQPASIMIMDATGNVSANGNLSAGEYCIVINDGNGCLAGEECFEVIEQSAINLEIYSTGNVYCDSLGSIYLSVSGGVFPYVFDWSDLAGTNDPSNREELAEGLYSVTATDANGCIAVLNDLVIENDCPSTSEITFVNTPLDTIVECDNIPTTFLPTATTTCPVAGVQVSMNESVSTTSCEYTITRTFTAVDDCGNMETAVQMITVIDTTIPDFLDVPADITVECNEVPAPPTFVLATDNCTVEPIVTMVEVEEGISCEPGNQIIRTWTAEDECGNTYSQSQIITVVNTMTEIILTEVPFDTLMSCDEMMPTTEPVVTTSCTVAGLNMVLNETIIEGICTRSYTLVRTWTATDGCGNVATASQSIEVYDNTAPEIILVENFVVDLVNGDSMPSEFIEVVDACDTEVEYFVDGTEMQTDDGYILTRDYTVIDDCGNESFATQSIDIIGGVVWPGDADSNKVVNFMDIFNIGFGFGATGTSRDNPTLDWFPQYTAPWTAESPLSAVNFRHADTDGNGVIDIYDVQAVSQNWGMTHNFRGEDEGDTRTLYEVDFELDTILPNGWVYIDVILGEENDPIDDFYGVGFVVEYDKNIVQESSAHLDFDESWGGAFFDDMIAIQKDFYEHGNIQTGLVRTDQEGISGYGKIASFRFQLKDGAELPGDFTLTTHSGEGVIKTGERYEVEEAEISVTKSKTVLNDHQLKVYPNPALDVLHLDVDPNLSLDKIELYNAAGLLVMTKNDLNTTNEISVANLGMGIYMLRLTIEGETVYRKVSIMR